MSLMLHAGHGSGSLDAVFMFVGLVVSCLGLGLGIVGLVRLVSPRWTTARRGTVHRAGR